MALKDAEIERLHSQLSRSAALHSDHAEKGNWLVGDSAVAPWPGFSLISGLVSLWVCEQLCEEARGVHVHVYVFVCAHTGL